jgi:hypothetical protein
MLARVLDRPTRIVPSLEALDRAFTASATPRLYDDVPIRVGEVA